MSAPARDWCDMDGVMLAILALVIVCLIVAVSVVIVQDSGGDRQSINRAEALLRSYLSPSELKELKHSGFLQVASRQHAGRVYDVSATGGRVTVRVNGTPEFELCVRPREPLPGREHVLAHKLMIEAAEDEYVKRANVVWRAGYTTSNRWRWWE